MSSPDSSPTLSKKRFRVKDITFEDLSSRFHLPITEVAKDMGVCATILKKVCRKFGIPRWPQRGIKSLMAQISAIDETLANEPADAEHLRHHRRVLEKRLVQIRTLPSNGVTASRNAASGSGGVARVNMKRSKRSKSPKSSPPKSKDLVFRVTDHDTEQVREIPAFHNTTDSREKDRDAAELLASLRDFVPLGDQRPAAPAPAQQHTAAPATDVPQDWSSSSSVAAAAAPMAAAPGVASPGFAIPASADAMSSYEREMAMFRFLQMQQLQFQQQHQQQMLMYQQQGGRDPMQQMYGFNPYMYGPWAGQPGMDATALAAGAGAILTAVPPTAGSFASALVERGTAPAGPTDDTEKSC